MSYIWQRLEDYKVIEELLKKENQVAKCGLTFVDSKRRIGSKSEVGLTYQLSFPSPNPKYNIAVKVVDGDVKENIAESMYYDMFNKLVLHNISPHFPLVWQSINCGDKCNFIVLDEEMFKNAKSRENINYFLIFSELLDGDLESYFYEDYRMDEEYFSCFYQIVMGMIILEKNNLVHNDIHLGNVLYKNIGNNSGFYFKYILENDIIYIKHNGKLAVLWDFGKMEKIDGGLGATPRFLSKCGFDPNLAPNKSIYWDLCYLSFFFSKLLEGNPISHTFDEIKKIFLDYTKIYKMKMNADKNSDQPLPDSLSILKLLSQKSDQMIINEEIDESLVTQTFDMRNIKDIPDFSKKIHSIDKVLGNNYINANLLKDTTIRKLFIGNSKKNFITYNSHEEIKVRYKMIDYFNDFSKEYDILFRTRISDFEEIVERTLRIMKKVFVYFGVDKSTYERVSIVCFLVSIYVKPFYDTPTIYIFQKFAEMAGITSKQTSVMYDEIKRILVK